MTTSAVLDTSATWLKSSFSQNVSLFGGVPFWFGISISFVQEHMGCHGLGSVMSWRDDEEYILFCLHVGLQFHCLQIEGVRLHKWFLTFLAPASF